MALKITIEGGAKEGKTTMIAAIRKLLQDNGARVVMAGESELREAEVRTVHPKAGSLGRFKNQTITMSEKTVKTNVNQSTGHVGQRDTGHIGVRS